MTDKRRKEYPAPIGQNGSFNADSSQYKMMAFLARGARVIEFGCGMGQMSKAMTEMGCRVTAIEIDPEAAEQTRSQYEDVIVADLDIQSLSELLNDREFDVAIFGDVLEHLRDPWRVLEGARKHIAADGFALLSIPNVAHASVRLSLLDGSFDYTRFGLLDDTHLRFFTLQSIKELCVRCGYDIEQIERTTVPLFEQTALTPKVDPDLIEPELVERIKRDPEHETLQFIVKARPLAENERDLVLFERFQEASRELAAERVRAVRLGERIAALQSELEAKNIEASRSDITALSEARQAVEAQLAERDAQLTAARETFERTLRERESELQSVRESAARADLRLQAVQESVRTYTAELAQQRTRIEELELDRQQLDRALDEQLKRANNAQRLEAQLAQRTHKLAEMERRLEAEGEGRLAAAEREYRSTVTLLEAERARSRRLESQLQTLSKTVDEYFDDEILRLRNELAQIDAEIRATRQSVFWKLKLRLSSLRHFRRPLNGRAKVNKL